MAVITVLTVLVGFARTYYLKPFRGAPPLPLLIHLHAAIFTTWLLLFLTQTTLVASGRVNIHRRLGVAGAALAAAMVVFGFLTAIAGARHGLTIGPLDPLGSLIVPVVDIGRFAVLVSAGLLCRRDAEWHRRLMLLAMVALTDPAIGRFPLVGSSIGFEMALMTLFVLAGPVNDWLVRGRVHPAYIWGGLLIMAGLPLKVLGFTTAWHTFAAWVIR